MCDAWLDFEVFLQDVGKRPGPDYSIDRIDNSLGYFPENCRWATRHQQARNTRLNRNWTIGGVTKTVAEWVEESGIHRSTITKRIRNGWSIADALTTPANHQKIRNF